MFNQSEKKLKTWATIQGMFFSVVAIVLGAVIYSAAAATDNNAVDSTLGQIAECLSSGENNDNAE